MNSIQLLRRTLAYFARQNLAVVAGVIAATATMTGALIVGDSVRDSLRNMTLDRLGEIDQVLTGPRFVTQRTVEVAGSAVPSIIVSGTLKANGRVAGSVQLVAIPPGEERRLWPTDALEIEADGVVLNARVATALDVAVGDRISVLVELPASIPRDSLLGERDEVLVEIVQPVTQILEASSGAGRFSLSPAQQIPSVAFIGLETIQEAIDLSEIPASKRYAGRAARVNTALIPFAGDAHGGIGAEPPFQPSWTLDDLDLRLISTPDGGISVESRAQILSDEIASAAATAAKQTGDPNPGGVLVYLVNEIANANDPSRFSTYSVLAGNDDWTGFQFVAGGIPVNGLSDDEVVINQWLADDLGVGVGEVIKLTYLQVGDTGDLPELTTELTVAGLVELEGPAVDRTMTPTVPGITDAETFDAWEQPFTMDLSRVTDRDEDYWEAHRATPKMYVSLGAMQERFASRYGQLTSVRVDGAERDALEEAILAEIAPEAAGLIIRNVRYEQLAASAGTTDFSGLFFGFSMFLIASSILLIGLLFRLGVEQRVRQLGLLRAVGLPRPLLRHQLLGEGVALAAIGSIAGLIAAVVYAQAMLYGLTTWWGGATGTRFLQLSVTPRSLVTGAVISVAVSAGVMWLAVRELNQQQPLKLLNGRLKAIRETVSPWTGRLAIGMIGGAAVMLVLLMLGIVPRSEAFAGFSFRVVGFFLTGFFGLIGGLAGFASLLARREKRTSFGLSGLGWRNNARSRGRSLLTTTLIALATFLLVAVGVARKDPTAIGPDRSSGNGGYRLVGETAVPLLTDVATAEGRTDAQFLADGSEGSFDDIAITSLRMRPGDDASCLNLYSARLPTLIGVPEATLRQWHDEQRFRFADTPSPQPWLDLLAEPATAGERLQVPVVGDMNTLLYSLHRGIGQSLPVPAEVRDDADLAIVGMLDGSVFQGTLLMSDTNLRRLDPSVVGYRYLLVESRKESGATDLLESGLADYGLDLEPVAVRIADFLAVQNTYLSTFQALGGLGLLLGTLGLGTVMLRNVVERYRELAMLRAVGFSQSRIRNLIVSESGLLLAAGLGIGTSTALLAMLPHLASSGADVPAGTLVLLLATVTVVGLLATGIAVRHATRSSLLETLKSE